MQTRLRSKYSPRFERLEQRLPLSMDLSPMPDVGAAPAAMALAARTPADVPAFSVARALPHGRPGAALRGRGAGAQAGSTADATSAPLVLSDVRGVTMDRITNPTPFNAVLRPPFAHVLVQSKQPIPGQTYNILFLSVWNGTQQTFTAADNLTVRISNQSPAHAFPILTGDQVWKPGQRIVFYLLTKKYYPLSPTATAGFEFNFVNPRVIAIPGPSGIFLRVKYNPATFDRVLDTIVVSGPGAKGHTLGLPDTAIWEIIPAGSVIPL